MPRRIIPKRVFQVLALCSLAVVWGTAAELAWRGRWPVPSLTGALGTALGLLATWVLASIAWMILVVPVRLFSQIPTIDEARAALGARDLAHAITLERERLTRAAIGTPAERRRYRLTMAGVSAVLAIAFGVGTAVNLELAPESLFLAPPLLAATFALFAVWNLCRGILGR